MPNSTYSIGFDFGTESVRVLIADTRDGNVAGQAVDAYRHCVIDVQLPGGGPKLPADYALQHPQDWLDSMGNACRSAMRGAGITPKQIVGIGVAFTSCTMLPTLADGTPLCLRPAFAESPMAWPKLWKHHGAKAETDRINQIARERNEPWLPRYGGVIGLEWFFPKVLETLNHDPAAYAAADVFLEAGDWLVWQLINGPFPDCSPAGLIRSTCQAGYKAIWNAHLGYPSAEFFAAVHPGMANVVSAKMPGTLRAPSEKAGELTAAAAKFLGLNPGTPVSPAIIDAHAGLPGAGVAQSSTLVMVMGTSSCHMMLSGFEIFAPGIAGVVGNGIIPGFYGYETGQASVGDAFAWIAQKFGQSHADLNALAADLPPGSGGVMALDWLNGCRTPLMDGRLSGMFLGLTLNTTSGQLYRAMMEATAFGVRWIVDTMQDAGLQVDRYVASGGLPGKSPLLMQIYADVLGAEIKLAASDQPVALGAAIIGCFAGEERNHGEQNVESGIIAMARQRTDLVYHPRPEHRAAYDRLYRIYRDLAKADGQVAMAMRELRNI